MYAIRKPRFPRSKRLRRDKICTQIEMAEENSYVHLMPLADLIG